jgi:hypothetical protein
MVSALRHARAICAALLSAGAAVPGTGLAQSPIDVPTLVTIAPHEEAPTVGAPRSSFDYEARAVPVPRPWDVPAPSGIAQTGTVAAAIAAATPSPPTAFVGAAVPLPCRQAAYHVILDRSSDTRSGTLCVLPDGSWQLLP